MTTIECKVCGKPCDSVGEGDDYCSAYCEGVADGERDSNSREVEGVTIADMDALLAERTRLRAALSGLLTATEDGERSDAWECRLVEARETAAKAMKP